MPSERDTGGWINYQTMGQQGDGLFLILRTKKVYCRTVTSNPHAGIFNLFCHTRGVFHAFDWPGILLRADAV